MFMSPESALHVMGFHRTCWSNLRLHLMLAPQFCGYYRMQVQNCYKIREDTSLENRTAILRQKDVRLRPPQNSPLATCGRAMEEASVTAAYRLAEAENKSYLAAEAVKEAERISKMAEDTDSMLQIVQEIYDQCNSKLFMPA